jgi:outer membrane protein OmpA-like peptidoglycan-associated protein
MRHITATLGSAVVLGSSLALFAAPASAQERSESYLSQHLRAPSNALELKIGTGYTQGFGNAGPSRPLQDLGGAGLGASLDVDYRLSRPWSVGVESQYQELTDKDNTSARGLAFNAGATYHLDPLVRGDPWVRVGTGYRLLWENDPSGARGLTVLRHGFELATAKIGYDVRVSEDLAIAPVIGADLNMFLWQDRSDTSASQMSSAQVGTFVYAGLQGRFDIGGERGGVAVARAVPPPPERVGVTEPQPESPIAPAPEPERVSPSLAVSEDILKACRLNLDAVEKAPKFEFDRSELLPADISILQQIGDCFATGPLKDTGMTLVGRADPRGTVEYNQTLGMKRATRVAAFLEQYGVDATRIARVSRGKLDAVGVDEATWAVDRRVDILER